MRERILCTVLACLMLWSLTACGGEAKDAPAGDDGSVREELTAVELARLMGNGINLGNTMEAYEHKELGVTAEVSAYETLWGQPVTTREMIEGMKAAGFDSIRIPIAWTNAMDFESGDYTIGEAYMNRIVELVDWAREAGMYVIINDHWDGSWWGMFGSATPETREKAMEQYVSMWRQIAECFQDYSDYLIFESGNEELGDRLNDIDVCDDSGSLSEDECYETANRINQTFVDTIRGGGGNNPKRFLLIAGYNTDVEKTCDSRFQMPTDTAENKLLVSVHYYTPWNYCGASSGQHWGTVKDYEEQNTLLKSLKKFPDAGYGVIIGEYAVIPKDDGTIKNDTAQYIGNFLDNCDLYGYCPMLWDCSQYFLRRELRMVNDELAALYESRSFAAQEKAAEPESVLRERMEAAIAAAPDQFEDQVNLDEIGEARAWIMYSSQDWSVAYSAGDTYDPSSKTGGVEAVDATVTGEGAYTVSLDFTGTNAGYARGVTFAALAVGNGELLYPGYVMELKELKVNGQPYEWTGTPYTTSDDGRCTRLNLFNDWVEQVPEEARTVGDAGDDLTASIVSNDDLQHIETIEATFDYRPQ